MTELRNGAWSDREVRHLRKLSMSGKRSADIAQALGRTPRSVEEKLSRLRVPRERRTVGPPLPSDEGCTRAKDIAANRWHLVDLKRAGHSPRQTELRIGSDGVVRAPALARDPLSPVGSPAALCVEG